MRKYYIDGKVIANNIRAERNRVKLTQEETAEQIDVTLRTYVSYETDAKNIKATMLYKLSILFGCPISCFYLQNSSTVCELKE